MNFQLFNTLKVIFCWLVLQFTYRPTVRLIQVTLSLVILVKMKEEEEAERRMTAYAGDIVNELCLGPSFQVELLRIRNKSICTL